MTKYSIKCRYDINIEALERRNWAIEYPYDSSKGRIKVFIK
jgi:hypothetical protein